MYSYLFYIYILIVSIQLNNSKLLNLTYET